MFEDDGGLTSCYSISGDDSNSPLSLEAHGIYYTLLHVFRMSAFKLLVKSYFQYMLV